MQQSQASSVSLANEKPEEQLQSEGVALSLQAGQDEENSPNMKEEQETVDPNLVTWDENDQGNPRNWSNKYRCWVTVQLGMLALGSSLGSSIIAPAGATIAAYIGVSQEISVLSISLYM